MKSLTCWSAVIGGLFWIVKGAAILLLGFQPPLLFEIAPLFFAVGIWGMYGPVNGRSFPLARLALISALLAGISAVVITLMYWFAPDLLPNIGNVTVLTPFFVLSGVGILLALLLLGIVVRHTQRHWSQLLVIMAAGFPLITGFLGMIGAWIKNDRLIEVPIILMGVAWIQLGWQLRQ